MRYQRAAAVATLAAVASLHSTPVVVGHGLMLDPLARNAKDGIATPGGNMWFSHGCTIGCSACNDTGVPVPAGFPGHNKVPVKPSPNMGAYYGDGCPNDHSKSKKPTIMDPKLTTMNAEEAGHDVDGRPWTQWHPWRAPGSTPPLDPVS